MKRLLKRLLLTLLAIPPTLHAQGFPVIDVSAIAQAVQAVQLATQQLEHAKAELERLGDPKVVKTPSAARLLESLGKQGLGKALEAIQSEATGLSGTRFNPGGLYRVPNEVFQDAGGALVARTLPEYRKFDAVSQAAGALERVLSDTESRRQDLRNQAQRLLRDLQGATTVAEIEKLQGVLGLLGAEAAAVDRERDTALARLVAQRILNETDEARRKVAQREETAASVRHATEDLGRVLEVDTSPVRIPSRP